MQEAETRRHVFHIFTPPGTTPSVSIEQVAEDVRSELIDLDEGEHGTTLIVVNVTPNTGSSGSSLYFPVEPLLCFPNQFNMCLSKVVLDISYHLT